MAWMTFPCTIQCVRICCSAPSTGAINCVTSVIGLATAWRVGWMSLPGMSWTVRIRPHDRISTPPPSDAVDPLEDWDDQLWDEQQQRRPVPGMRIPGSEGASLLSATLGRGATPIEALG